MTQLTCLMPVYNASQSLEQSIESVLSQTHQDFHFFIFNDGSEDDSLKILQKYQKKDSRIQVFSEELPFGIPYALNQLMKKTRTKYFTFQGASDLSTPERFEKLLSAIKQTSLVALGSSYILDQTALEKESKTIQVSEFAKEVFMTSFSNPKSTLFNYLSGIYSKKIIDKGIEFDETIPAYYNLLFLALIQNYFPLRISNTKEVLYTQRLYPGCIEDLIEKKRIRVDLEQVENFFLAKLSAPYQRYIVEPQVFKAIVPF